MALPKSFENLVKSWKKLKIDVGDRVWENSRHTCLFKMHPEEYKKCIINFLQLVIRNTKIRKLNVYNQVLFLLNYRHFFQKLNKGIQTILLPD